MAKIVHSDAAPAEAVHYVLTDSSGGSVEFDLGGNNKRSYESADPALLSNAEIHPWLDVVYDPAETVQGAYREQIAAADDPFAAAYPFNPNDPDEARKAEEEKGDLAGAPVVALDAGKTQTEPVVTSGVAETLAADETSKTSDKVSGS